MKVCPDCGSKVGYEKTKGYSSFCKKCDVEMIEVDDKRASLYDVDWVYKTVAKIIAHVKCPKCESKSIEALDFGYPDVELTCNDCQHKFEFKTILPRLLHKEFPFGGQSYENKDYDQCPECEEIGYIHKEGCCVLCDYDPDKECSECGKELKVAEFANGICGACG